MKNPDRPVPRENEEGTFITVRDGIKIFVYEYVPLSDAKCTIYIISGITGINHNSEKEIIEKLSNKKNRIVVIHPRGTGYSGGKRGDYANFSDFTADYTEIIKGDTLARAADHKKILYGHSMSCAAALVISNELEKTDGLILINPPVKLKSAKGMTPGPGDYLKYIAYYIFAPHIPVVNMAGNPAVIENEAERKESEARNNDPLLVKYFSMHCMSESKKFMGEMVKNAIKADCPLLLLYGENDMIVDRAGCDEIFSVWKNHNKKYEIISGGSHGKSTVLRGLDIITKWIENI